jgi:hypothetical protein
MRLTIFLILLVVTFTTNKLVYLSGKYDQMPIEDIINKFTELQEEKYRKVF